MKKLNPLFTFIKEPSDIPIQPPTAAGTIFYFENGIFKQSYLADVVSGMKYNDPTETLTGDILKRVDKETGVDVNYREVTTWHDGTVMTDAKVDGVIFVKSNSKYYRRTFSGYINVKWFGAKGDGITDDTSAIQSAFNLLFSLRTHKLNSIYFPSGIYKVSNETIFPSECELIGESKNSTIIWQTSDTKNAIVVRESLTVPNNRNFGNDTVIRDLTVRGMLFGQNAFGYFDRVKIAANNSNSGIVLDGVVRSALTNVNTEGFETAGVFYNNSFYHKMNNVFSKYNKIGMMATGVCTSIFAVNSEFRFNGQGHYIADSYACKFLNCLFESNHTHYLDPVDFNNGVNFAGIGIALKDSSRITYTNCYFEAHLVTGWLQNTENVSFVDNFISSGSHASIFPQTPADGHSFILVNSKNNHFINNDHYTSPTVGEPAVFYFTSDSTRNRIVFKSEDEFRNCIENSPTINSSFTNKDDCPVIECPTGNVMYLNGTEQALFTSVFVGPIAKAPQKHGAFAVLTDRNYNAAWSDGTNYITFDLNVPGVRRSGTTAQRTDANTLDNGFQYYDTTLKKVLYADQTNNRWLDAMGTPV